jgi:hypothetical protein
LGGGKRGVCDGLSGGGGRFGGGFGGFVRSGGGCHCSGFGGFALGFAGLAEIFGFAAVLEQEKVPEVAVHFAGDALLVDGQVPERFAFEVEDSCLGQSVVEFGVVGRDVGGSGEVAHREGVFFDGVDSVESPVGNGYEVGEAVFGGVGGFEGGYEWAGEFIEGLAVFVGHDIGGSGEVVTGAIEGGAFFTFFGFGAGTFLCIFAVGVELFFGYRHGVGSSPGGWHGLGRRAGG